MENWRPVDYVVAFLALVVCIITTGAILSATMHSEPMTKAEEEILASLTASMISIISMYVGASIQKARDGDK